MDRNRYYHRHGPKKSVDPPNKRSCEEKPRKVYIPTHVLQKLLFPAHSREFISRESGVNYSDVHQAETWSEPVKIPTVCYSPQKGYYGGERTYRYKRLKTVSGWEVFDYPRRPDRKIDQVLRRLYMASLLATCTRYTNHDFNRALNLVAQGYFRVAKMLLSKFIKKVKRLYTLSTRFLDLLLSMIHQQNAVNVVHARWQLRAPPNRRWWDADPSNQGIPQ